MPAIILNVKPFRTYPILPVAIALLVFALLAFSPDRILAADPFAAADISITDTVVADDVEPEELRGDAFQIVGDKE